jgi:phage portal protein BeeE
VVTCLDLRGNAYILQDENSTSGVPVHLWLINPDRVSIARDKNTDAAMGYWLSHPNRDQEFIESDRMIHFKYYNPWDDELGMSPLDVARITYETEWEAI